MGMPHRSFPMLLLNSKKHQKHTKSQYSGMKKNFNTKSQCFFQEILKYKKQEFLNFYKMRPLFKKLPLFYFVPQCRNIQFLSWILCRNRYRVPKYTILDFYIKVLGYYYIWSTFVQDVDTKQYWYKVSKGIWKEPMFANPK